MNYVQKKTSVGIPYLITGTSSVV